MARTSNDLLYPIDSTPELSDLLFGSDSKKFLISNVLDLINAQNLIQFEFTDGLNVEITRYTAGKFLTNNNTLDPLTFTKLYFNKSNLKPLDLSPLFDKLALATNLVLRIEKQDNSNSFFDFAITSIENHTDYFTFNITNNFYSGLFENNKRYNIYFTKKGIDGADGVDGYTPIKGVDYFDGIQGETGIQGVTGSQGLKGDTGLQGAQGIQGNQGVPGNNGINGTNGIDGIDGTNGIQGVQGVQGNTGAQGLKGDTGNAGSQGIQGIQGVKGDTGDAGAQGIQGIQGDTGLKGDTGNAGTNGADGSQGLQGIQGVKGDTGLTGDQGIQGIQGVKGDTGTAGINGTNGTFLKGTSILNFGNESDNAINTITNAVITNANLNTVTVKPTETTETSLDDFTLNGVSFNIENIIDNTSFDIRANALNNASGNYTITYSLGY